jgi:hypothetical protein
VHPIHHRISSRLNSAKLFIGVLTQQLSGLLQREHKIMEKKRQNKRSEKVGPALQLIYLKINV